MHAECQSIYALTQLSTFKDQTSTPTKKKEKEEVMPKDRHLREVHLNFASLFWTVLTSKMLSSDWL